MRSTFNYIALLCFCGSLIACKERLDTNEYIKWLNSPSSGLQKTKSIGNYSFTLQYKPVEYVLLSEKNGKTGGADAFAKRKNEMNGLQYFDLTIKATDGDFIRSQSVSEKDFYDRLYYYSFAFQDDIKLVDGTDTLECRLFHFLRSYDLKTDKKFLLAFEKNTDQTRDKTLMINSDVFGVGYIRIKIEKAEIENIPELKI